MLQEVSVELHLAWAKVRDYAYKMTTIAEIRRANLNLLLKEVGEGRGAAAELARLTGVKAPIISQLRRVTYYTNGVERTMGEDVARHLERAMGKPLGWMDQRHDVTNTVEETEFLRTYRALRPDQQAALAALAQTMARDAPPQIDKVEKNLAH